MIDKYNEYMSLMSSHELNILRCKNNIYFHNIGTISKRKLFNTGKFISKKMKRKLTLLEQRQIIKFK